LRRLPRSSASIGATQGVHRLADADLDTEASRAEVARLGELPAVVSACCSLREAAVFA
jgi:hypothetical protein